MLHLADQLRMVQILSLEGHYQSLLSLAIMTLYNAALIVPPILHTAAKLMQTQMVLSFP